MIDDGRILLVAGLAALVAVKRFAPGSRSTGSRCSCGGSANGSRNCGCGSFAKAGDVEEVIFAWSRSRPGITETAHLKTDGKPLHRFRVRHTGILGMHRLLVLQVREGRQVRYSVAVLVPLGNRDLSLVRGELL